MTLRDGMREACKAALGPERRTTDGQIEDTDLLAALRCRAEERA